MHIYRSRLEENKKVIRKLEDENLNLKSQLKSSKEKELKYIQENRELKALLRKYYNKVHGDNKSLNDSNNSVSIESPYIRKSSRSYTVSVNKVNSSPTTTVLHSDNESPSTTTQPPVLQSHSSTPHIQINGEPVQPRDDQLLDALERSDHHEIGSGGMNSTVPKVKSLFSRKEFSMTTDKDSLGDSFSEHSISSTPSVYTFTASGQLGDRFKDLRSENKIQTIDHLPQQTNLNRSLDESPLHFRKSQTVVMDSNGLVKTVETLLEKECIR